MRTLVLTDDQHSALKALLDLVCDTEVGEAMAHDIETMGHDGEAWKDAVDAVGSAVDCSTKRFHAVLQAMSRRFAELPPEDQAEALLEALPGDSLETAHAVWLDATEALEWSDEDLRP